MRDLTYRPEEFSSFVGRTSEISELRELMRAMRAVTLCGAGGIGKTRLALRLLAAIAAEFPDGAAFVELSEVRQPEHVVPRVAAAVGVHEERGRPLIDTLADSLRHRKAILVLDNCEHLVNACAALCKHLLASSPGLQIVCTSREPLRVAAEAVWQVPPLALPAVVPPPGDPDGLAELCDVDAVRLFATRAAAATPAFTLGPANAAAVATICRALDGLPLAIELAAAWVRVLSVDQIAARLDRRLALLTSADRSVPARQQTLRATFDWSYDLLSGPEQIMLRRLSVFPGWSLDMAEKVCADDSLPAADIVDLLTALADKSLIELEPEVLGEARYRLLETVREYAAGWLALAGETAVMERRRREYTVRETERAAAVGMALEPAPWSARVDAIRRFEVETPNLYEVLGSCLSDGDAETGLRICAGTRLVWIVHGTFAEGAAWIDKFLALPEAAAVPETVRGRALISRAQLAMASGSPEADEQASAGLELCWAAGEQFWVAAGLNLLTEIALHAGHPDTAAERAEEALKVARSAGDRWNEGYALGTMAAIAGYRGNFRAAQRLGEEALLVMREIQQLWGSARALLGLGDLAQERGEHGIAREYYLEALAVLREVDARPEIARCLAGLGRIALDQWDLVSARQHLAESLRLSYASGSRIGMARGLEALARLSVMEGNPALSVQLAGAMTALRAQAALPPVRGARTQHFLDAAAGLGEHTVRRLWAEGEAMTPTDAVRLALALGAHADVPGPWATATAAAGLSRVATNRAATSAVATGSAANNPVANNRAASSTVANSTAANSTAAAGPATALTQREHEVVGLLAAGLSNRDIAAKLFISPATAARHVANILAKLGFSSRSQVAAWASRQPAGQADPNSALTDSPS
ncbi:MAG TPA: LuxR C-terminal-related transcriptional regulator [Streptosporangiaceae bacterium]|nr:LuxR C-terminal-related transcriptional regulator [Streptosporangiaceae bacterium]